MLNKTKNNEGLRRNPSAVANRRPKRCHLCKKTFAFDKYVSYRKDRTNIFRTATAFKTKRLRKARPGLPTSLHSPKTKAPWPTPNSKNLNPPKNNQL